MSMDCDTRLSMMAMRQRAANARTAQPALPRRTPRVRRASQTVAAGMAAFALTLFSRGF
ncbi:MAG: hypothetical protein KUA35_01370 [Pseudodesulfovibrio sp.]|uniref:Uncharacterized protein n=1 Tax=Pseudodesulfovibrio aespoeensis (strain ATCC 700646 / DSM 10631 / Aspo-2) TaxID=643562 RepID=E6VSF0_PSEA9|nr:MULTISPECIES: hypothetical protein [Pseudodesulfovibrio]MBU4192153.1 hypothetical protein [Pseudomonadota bacterium]ADU64293.1 hypothetical protein Daes_3305 [Pseudodesulfovibrio aespoeensis Aspo-2]MBU4242918.1 hypothetical protein [Pseudomonadota bacterium]MBU4378960.1 hypothetical protein [Pseudomonadota bacterium]MBU4474227.1 hypothetical protein [Pseudomonadota bacterium]